MEDRTFIWTTLGHIIRYATPLGLAGLVFYGSGWSGYGQFTTALAISGPIYVIASLSLRNQVLASKLNSDIRTYLNVRTTSSLLAGLIYLIMVHAFLPGVVNEVLLSVLLYKSGESFIDLVNATEQKRGKPGLAVAQSSAIGISLVVSWLVFHLWEGSKIALVGCTAVYAAQALVLFVFVRTKSHHRPTPPQRYWPIVSSGLMFSAGFALVNLGATLVSVAVFNICGAETAGKFSLLLYAPLILELLANPAAQYWLLTVSRSGTSSAFWAPSWLNAKPKWVLLGFTTVTTFVVLYANIIDPLASRVEAAEVAIALAATCTAVIPLHMLSAHLQFANMKLRYLLSNALALVLTFCALYLWHSELSLGSALLIIALASICRPLLYLFFLKLPIGTAWLKSDPIKAHWVVIGSANGSGNFGDQAMYDALIKEFRKKFPDDLVITDAAYRDWQPLDENTFVLPSLHLAFRQVLGRGLRRLGRPKTLLERALRSRDRTKTFGFISRFFLETKWRLAVQSSRGLIFAGAGAISSTYFDIGIAEWSRFVMFANAKEVPVYFLGQGISEMPENIKSQAVTLLSSAKLLTLRDAISAKYAQEMGLTGMSLSRDWALAGIPSTSPHALLNGRYVCLALHRNASIDVHGYQHVLFEVAHYCSQNRLSLVLTSSYQGRNSDSSFICELLESVNVDPNLDIITSYMDCSIQTFLNLLAHSERVVTTRYHMALFASELKTEVYALAVNKYWEDKLLAALAPNSASRIYTGAFTGFRFSSAQQVPRFPEIDFEHYSWEHQIELIEKMSTE